MKMNERPIEDQQLINDLRERVKAMDFPIKWLVSELVKRYEKALTRDTVEVVRCKDCKYYFHYGAVRECSHPMMCSDDRDAFLNVNDDDFCSHAKEKN